MFPTFPLQTSPDEDDQLVLWNRVEQIPRNEPQPRSLNRPDCVSATWSNVCVAFDDTNTHLMREELTDHEIQQAIYIARLMIIVPYTILLYDYALTLGREVARYWGTRLTWGSFCFYLNRYIAIFGTIPIVVQYFSTTSDPQKLHVCLSFQLYHQFFALVSQMLVAVMLIMRTYALYERNKFVLAFMIFITLTASSFAVWVLASKSVATTLSPRIEAFGCPRPIPHSKSLRLAGAWSGMLVFDVMIFIFTLCKALRHTARKGNLVTILLRDGTAYFGGMVAVNAFNIGTETMGGPFTSGNATTLTNLWGYVSNSLHLSVAHDSPSVSSIMLSRLMLNLRGVAAVSLPSRNLTRTQYDATLSTTWIEARTANPESRFGDDYGYEESSAESR